MISLLWLSSLLLLATCAGPSLGSLFDLDHAFWKTRVSEDTALAFFSKLTGNDDVTGNPRSAVGSAAHPSAKHTDVKPKPSASKHAKRPHTRSVGQTVNAELNGIKEGLDLSTLTNGALSGDNFQVSDPTAEEAGKQVIMAKFRNPGSGIPLCGGDLMFTQDKDKTPLVLKFHSSNPTFEDTEIIMDGETYFNNLTAIKIATKIEKKENSDVFEITSFDLTSKAVNILDLLGNSAATFNELLDLDLNTDVIEKLKDELSAFKGFGAFNSDSLQLVIYLDDTSSITQAIKATSISLLIAQNGARTPRELSAFVTFDDFIPKLGELFSQTELFENNFLLKHLKGEVCLFLVILDIAYLDPIKSDERMAACFGNQEDEKAQEAFKSTDAGLHATVKVDFKDAMLKGCWNERDDTPADLADKDMEILIYATISKSGIGCSMLSDATISTKLILECFGGLMRQAPEYLTGGQITLNQLSREVIEEDNKKRTHWKVNFLISPAEEFSTLPGTSISLKNFEVDAEGDQGDGASWNIDAKLAVTIGTESNIDFAIKKEESEYFLEATSSKITLGDLLKAFTVPAVGDSDSKDILDTLGVKDFSFSMKMGKDLPAYEFLINGKPIIFGFDKLEISAILVKEKKTSGKRAGGGGGGSLKYTIGLYLNGADFSAVAKNLFNKDINMQWLSGLKAIAVFTNDAGNVVLKAKEVEEEKKGKKAVKGRLTKKHTKTIKKVKKAVKQRALVQTGDTKVERSSLQRASSRRTLTRETREDDTEEESPSELAFDELVEGLQDKDITHPITLAVIWTIPNDVEECKENPLCKWMVENIKPSSGEQASVSIIGELGNGEFKLTAAIDIQVKLIDKPNEKLIFTGLELELEVGSSMPQVQLSASMTYENEKIGATGDNQLKFTGAITATPISLSLSFTMEGFIFPKFGDTSYIAIGDLTLGGGYSGGLPSFTFGVAIKLGIFPNPPETPDAIEIRGSFGVSPGNPDENWMYGSINHLTVKHVCDAFKLKCDSVPSALMETGFPNGITASYTSQAREVPGVGEIPEGLFVKGTINIFGMEVSCEFSMSTEGVSFELEMSPLDWGNGMIQVLRSEDDTDNGPKAFAKFSTSSPEDFEFSIEGYGNILKILSLGVTIQIDSSRFLLKVSGYLIPAFLHAEIEIKANYGGGDADGVLFSVKASISATFAETLKKAINEFMVKLQAKVKEAFDKAKEVFVAAERKVNASIETVGSWKTKIRNWKASLADRKKKLEDDMKPPPCNCPDVCFAFLDWDSECWKIWGYWVGCPYWNSCFKMIADIFCLAGCGIRKIVNAIVKWAMQAILTIGQLIAAGVEGLLTLAQGVLELAKGVLKVASKVVEAFGSLIAAALKLAAEALKKLLDQFALHKLTLSATLTADYTACLGYFYNITFFGSDQTGTGEVCLDLTSFTNKLIGGVTEKNPKTAGSTKAPERLKEIESEQGEVTKANAEFDKENADAASKVKEETSKKFEKPSARDDIPKLQAIARSLENVPRHHTAPTKEDMEMTELANRKIPKYDVRGDAMVRSFVDTSPWQLADYHRPVGHNDTVRHDDTETGQRRTLDFDADLTPCKRMKRALEGYSQVTDGILKYSEAVQKSRDAMHRSRIADHDKLNDFQSLVQDADRKHNMTGQERDDAYFVYNNLAHRHEELVRKSQIALHTEDKNALPIIRRHINTLLGKEKGSNFMKFTDIMHLNAMEGYKRSKIPHPEEAQGEKILGNIKQDLQAIVTDESNALTPMTPRVQDVKKNIIAMTEYIKQCRDN